MTMHMRACWTGACMQATAVAAEARGIGRAVLPHSVAETSGLAVSVGASGGATSGALMEQQAAARHGVAAKALLSLRVAGSGRSLTGEYCSSRDTCWVLGAGWAQVGPWFMRCGWGSPVVTVCSDPSQGALSPSSSCQHGP